MFLPKQHDAIHRAWLFRLLTAIADDSLLNSQLRFKGGTCAAMRGLLDRFSVDLDFDLLETKIMPDIRKHLEAIFEDLGLEIKDFSKKVPQYFLKYPNPNGQRNTLLIDITCPPPKNNDYEAVRLIQIDRIIYCQTVPTMFANKLVTVMERYKKFGSIAGRDIFDVHAFALKGYGFKPEIIEERTGKTAEEYLKELASFIDKHVTQTIIDQDINTLLPAENFRQIRKTLKQETLAFLREI